MNQKFKKDFIETVERIYGSLDNFKSLCHSYHAFYSENDDHSLDLRRYTLDGLVPIVVERAIYHGGMVDVNAFVDGVRRGFVVCEAYSKEIMRVCDLLPDKSEKTVDGTIHLNFLEGALFMASVEASYITYLMPLDIKEFEDHLRTLVEAED